MEKGLSVLSVVSPFRFILIGEIKGLHYEIIPSRKKQTNKQMKQKNLTTSNPKKPKKQKQARLPLGGAGMLGCHSAATVQPAL